MLLLSAMAVAQLPAPRPQSQFWLNDRVEVELRLKTDSGATARVAVVRFSNISAKTLTARVPCWNKTTTCPRIASVTARVYLVLPWDTARLNVTRFSLCEASECAMPGWIGPIQAKPGEAYEFVYDRIGAQWMEMPRVVPR